MSLKLTPLVKGSGPSVLLQRPIYLVGRHPECDLQLELPKISRRHCCFALAYDRLIVRDLGSRNGVRVNGREVVETQLFRGDEVAIGPMIYRVEQDESPEGRVPRRPAADEPEIDLVPLDDV
jgi:pSer/pThr/pTyr-binding forkhead associated (FHA) protein